MYNKIQSVIIKAPFRHNRKGLFYAANGSAQFQFAAFSSRICCLYSVRKLSIPPRQGIKILNRPRFWAVLILTWRSRRDGSECPAHNVRHTKIKFSWKLDTHDQYADEQLQKS